MTLPSFDTDNDDNINLRMVCKTCGQEQRPDCNGYGELKAKPGKVRICPRDWRPR
jgi:hypothetical protein